MEEAEKRWRQVRGSELKLFILLVDLDRFKSVNDTYGHAVGDLVLAGASAAMQTAPGSDDLLARYGGEEFVVLLTRYGASAARQVEALRAAVAGIRVPFEKREIRVTTSVGTARAEPGEPTVALAIARADIAVYAARDAGLDRVVESL